MNIRKMIHQMNIYKSKFVGIEEIIQPSSFVDPKPKKNNETEETIDFKPIGAIQENLEVSQKLENISSGSSNSIGINQSSRQVDKLFESPATFRIALKKKKINRDKFSMNTTISNLQELGIQRKALSHRKESSQTKPLRKIMHSNTLQTKNKFPTIISDKKNKKKSPKKSPSKKYRSARIHRTIDVHDALRSTKISPKRQIYRKNSITPWELQVQQIDTLW